MSRHWQEKNPASLVRDNSLRRRQRPSVAAERLCLGSPGSILLLPVVEHATSQTAIHQVAISQIAYKQTYGPH
jgi:hypothetical protein